MPTGSLTPLIRASHSTTPAERHVKAPPVPNGHGNEARLAFPCTEGRTCQRRQDVSNGRSDLGPLPNALVLCRRSLSRVSDRAGATHCHPDLTPYPCAGPRQLHLPAEFNQRGDKGSPSPILGPMSPLAGAQPYSPTRGVCAHSAVGAPRGPPPQLSAHHCTSYGVRRDPAPAPFNVIKGPPPRRPVSLLPLRVSGLKRLAWRLLILAGLLVVCVCRISRYIQYTTSFRPPDLFHLHFQDQTATRPPSSPLGKEPQPSESPSMIPSLESWLRLSLRFGPPAPNSHGRPPTS